MIDAARSMLSRFHIRTVQENTTVKHVVTAVAVALVAATFPIANAQDAKPEPAPGAPAGNVATASSFADGSLPTILAIGLGVSAAITVFVVGAGDNGPNNSTSTATATTR